MNVEKIVCGIMQENAYLAYRETGECLLVDPGAEAEKIERVIREKQLNVIAVLLTHGHFDHTGAAAHFQSLGVPVYIHERDAAMLTSSRLSLAFGMGGAHVACRADVEIVGEDQLLKIGSFEVQVLTTPGHTRGGVCYVIGDGEVVFSGDTLFRGDVGRSDFPGGNEKELIANIREKLFVLPDCCRVFPGHGPSSTMQNEKIHNTYVLNYGE